MFLANCSFESAKKNFVQIGQTIHVSLDQPKQEVSLDDLFSEYKYIALETNDSVLIKDLDFVYRITTTSQAIYVGNDNEILLFDREGHFVRKIKRQGEGPEEYRSILNFTVHPNGYISLLEGINGENRIITYNSDGAFINRSKYQGLKIWDIAMLDDSLMFLRTFGGNIWGKWDENPERYNIYVANWRTKNILNAYYPVKPSRVIHLYKSYFSHYNENILLSMYRSTEVYELMKDSCQLRYKIDMDGLGSPEGFWTQQKNTIEIDQEYAAKGYIDHIPFFMESEELLLFRYEGGTEERQGYVSIDKRNGETRTFMELPFTPSFRWKPHYLFPQPDGTVIIPIPSFLLSENKMETLTYQFPGLNEESNPILFIGKLR